MITRNFQNSLVLLLLLGLSSSLIGEQLQAWGQSKPLPRTGRTYVGTTKYEGDGVRVNTGPTAVRSSLQVLTSSTGVHNTSSPGQIYENLVISGEMTIDEPNVVIRNCYINGNTSTYVIRQTGSGTNLLIENCEIYNGRSAVLFLRSSATVRNCHLHSARGDIIKPASNCTIEGNYIEKVGSAPGAHGDGIQWTSGSNCLVRWNNFDMPHPSFTEEPDPNSRFANSQCIIGGTQSGTLRDITVTQNWMNGGGFSLNIGGTPDAGPNIVVTENLFGRELEYNPITGESSNWVACNRWEDDLTYVSNQDSIAGCADINSGTVADVIFSPNPAGGEVVSPLSVSLSSPTSAASIRYTLNGAEPSSSEGIDYVLGTSFTLLSGQTLKAIAYQEGLNDSRVTSADYNFVGAVVVPEITPEAGSYLQRPTIDIQSGSIGAEIFYTIDDSDPIVILDSNVNTLDSVGGVTKRFLAPFVLPSIPTVTVKAIAVKDGEVSSVISNYYTIASITSSGDTWFNLETPITYNNVFHFSCEITPFFDQNSSGGTNTLIGFCEGPADWFSDLAVSIRFYTNGKVEAYNGSAKYEAVQDFSYQQGETYTLGVIVDVENKTYDAKILKTIGSSLVDLRTIADDFQFRPTQSDITSISNLTMWTDAVDNASTYHDNFEFASGIISPPTTPPTGPDPEVTQSGNNN